MADTDSDGSTGAPTTTSPTSTPSTSASTTVDPSTSTTEDTDATTTSEESSSTGEGDLEVTITVTQYEEQPMVVDVELTTNIPVTAVSLVHTTDDGVVIDGGGSDMLWNYRVRGLAPATLHALEYDVDGLVDTVEFTAHAPLPGFIPSFVVDEPGAGFDPTMPYRMFDLIPFPAFDTAGVFMVDGEGTTRWHLGGPSNETPGPEGVWTAAKPRPDGTFMYLHLHEFWLRDELGQTILNFADEDLGVTGLHHEILELPSGNFMALTHTFQEVDYEGVPTLTSGDGIVEFTPDGEVVWEWDMFDHLDPQRITEPVGVAFVTHPETGELTYDWTHANGIEYDPATDTLLVSIRHQDWIINVDHQTGDVLWRLGYEGDFVLDSGDENWFYHPHSPQWQPDGSMLLYDNGIGNPFIAADAYTSRAMRLELDTDAMTASIVWEDDAEPFQASFAGDADLLPRSGRYIVTDSSIFGMAGIYSRLRELDPTASPMIQWSLLTPDGSFAYRATAQPRIMGMTE